MTDQLHSSGDVPRFDTYPAPAPEENGREADRQPYAPVNLNVDYGAPAGSGPAAENPHMNAASDQSASNQRPFNRGAFDQTALNQTAEKIGTLIGTAVNIVKSVPRQLQSVPGNVASVRDRLRERGEELRQDASEAAHQWRQTAQAKVQQARERTAQYVRENPFHVIVAVAGVAFCLGVTLRIWRSSLE